MLHDPYSTASAFVQASDDSNSHHYWGRRFEYQYKHSAQQEQPKMPSLQNCARRVEPVEEGGRACAFLKMCLELDVPAPLERSRSGNGGHVWIFFSALDDICVSFESG